MNKLYTLKGICFSFWGHVLFFCVRMIGHSGDSFVLFVIGTDVLKVVSKHNFHIKRWCSCCLTVTQRVQLVENCLPFWLFEFIPVFNRIRVAQSLVVSVISCQSLFCLSFVQLRLMITTLSSKCSSLNNVKIKISAWIYET